MDFQNASRRATFFGNDRQGESRTGTGPSHGVVDRPSRLMSPLGAIGVPAAFDVAEVDSRFAADELGVLELHDRPHRYGGSVVETTLGNVGR